MCDPEELQGVPTRNILFSLRSAAARQTKPSTVPRRSPRLVPQVSAAVGIVVEFSTPQYHNLIETGHGHAEAG